MEVVIGGRRTAIDGSWKQPQVQENLLKSCLSLTRIHAAAGQNISTTESLATCLIQHASGCYSGISNLNDAWESNATKINKSTEEEWIRFRLKLESKHQQESPLLTNGNLQIIIDSVVDILDKFTWFRLVTAGSLKVVYLVDDGKVNICHQILTDVNTNYVWFDRETGIFYGITKYGETFKDQQAYRIALMCQVTQSLKDFFRFQLSKENPNDDELERRSLSFLGDLKNQLDRTVEDHEQLVITWKGDAQQDGLLTMLRELLHPNFSKEKKEIERELRHEFIENLERAYEELQIEHRQAYEVARLQAVENREEDERHARRCKILIKEAAAEVDRLQRALDEKIAAAQGVNDEKRKKDRARSRWRWAKLQVLRKETNVKSVGFSGIANLIIERQRELINSKKKKLEWNRFCVLLGGSHPFYELARLGRNHHLFNVDWTAVKLVEDVIKEFGLTGPFCKQNGDTLALMSYVKNKSSTVKNEVKRILEKMVQDPIQTTTGQLWKFDGSALLLSQIQSQVSLKNLAKCEEILVCASCIIYVDCDWNTPGVSLGLSAPQIEVVGSAKRSINTSGRDAIQIEPKKAKDGVGKGISGNPGESGKAGDPAGHVTIKCDTLRGQKLHIKARGGKGADGQHGGDGQPGDKGDNGNDGKLKSPKEVEQDFTSISLRTMQLVPFWGAYEVARNVVNYCAGSTFNTKHFVEGGKGKPGTVGGSGGHGGSGGEGGKGGQVEIQVYKSGKHLVDPIESGDGSDGVDGQPGKGAKGGEGGRHGLDVARVFEPDDLNPWFKITGNWVEERGHLKIQQVLRTSDQFEIGHKIIVKNANDKGSAENGQDGEDGEKADSSEQKKSNQKRTMVSVGDEWKSSTDSTSDALRSTEAAVARLDKLMIESEENQKRLEEAKKQEEENEKKLKRAKEMENQMKEAFQQAKMLQSTTQSRALQRTLTIADDKSIFNAEPNPVTRKQVKNIHAIKTTASDSGWDTLKDVSLLDALVAKFANNTEASQMLSLLTQSLVLQIHLEDQQDLWIWLTNIVRRHLDSAEDSVDALKCINQDIELVQSIVSSRQQTLLFDLKETIVKKFPQFRKSSDQNPLGIIYQFRQMTWTYEELQNLLKPLEVNGESDNIAKNQLKEIFGDQLISIVCEKMASHFIEDVATQKLMALSQTLLLKELFQCCCRNKSKSVPLGPFFDKIVDKLKGGLFDRSKKKTADQVEIILNDFVRKKLKIVTDLHELMPTDELAIDERQLQQLDKLIFIVDRIRIEVKELDKIRSRIVENENKEPFKSICQLTDQAFDKFYWNREWNEIQDLLDQLKTEILEPADFKTENWTIFTETLNKLKTALMWKSSRKSFQQKLEFCSELKKKLKRSGWMDSLNTAVGKVKQVTSSDAKIAHFRK